MPGIGDALSTVGNTLVAIEGAKVQRRREGAMREARVQTIERLGELNTRYQQDTDYNGLSDRFQADADQAFASIAETLPPDLRERYMQDARETLAPQKQAFARLEYGLERQHSRVSGQAALRTYVNESANAPDEDSRLAIMSEAAAFLASAVEDGTYTPEEADAMLQKLATDSDFALALGMSIEDPDVFLERLDDGAFPNIDPVTKERLQIGAKAEISRRDAQAAKQLDVEAKAAQKAQAATVDDAIAIIENGRPYTGLAELQAQVKGTPDEARLNATLRAQQVAGNFAVLSPAQMAAEIAQIAKTATNDPADIARLERLRAMRSNTIKSLENDPLSHAKERGITTLGPVDFDDRATVRDRISTAEAVAEDVMDGLPPSPIRYFTNDERDSLAAIVQADNADAKLSLVNNLVNTFGPRAPAVLAEIGASDPVFELAGNLVSQTGQVEVARTLLNGQRLLAEGQGAKVKKVDRDAVRASVAEMFPRSLHDRFPLLLEAADAYYAVSGQMANPEAEPEARRRSYMKAVQAAAGQVTRNGRTYGGIQMVNGRQTLLPATLDAATAEALLEKAKPEDWVKASVSGAAPMWGGKPLPELFTGRAGSVHPGRLALEYIGRGQYLVSIQRQNGELRYLTDDAMPDGKARLSLERLLELQEGR